ncbi:hypothetical protein [Streptomyces gardneri]|uniref:hypothetical protein n=1 Tax=Streptomyces gardneri TaxID=66892 RepID=UPI0035DB5EFE
MTEQNMRWPRRNRPEPTSKPQKPAEKPRWDITNDKRAYDDIPAILTHPQMPYRPFSRDKTLLLLVPGEGDEPPTSVPGDATTLVSYLSSYIDTYGVRTVGKGENMKQEESPKLISEKVCKAAANGIDFPYPTLTAIITSPVVLPDGTLLAEPGYHEPSGLFLHLGETIPDIPDVPTEADVAAAKKLLVETVLGDFEFVHASDLPNYLGLLFTPLLRFYAGGLVPLFYITADNPGSGKSYLLKLVGTLFGYAPMPWPKDNEEEIRKQITAILHSSAEPLILIDNVPEGTLVKSPQLASLLTYEEWSDRPLGFTRMVRMDNNRIWGMTGNNISMGGDMPRRVVGIHLTCSAPHPEDRDPAQFAVGDLLHWARAHRGEVLHAMLVLVASWLAAGAKEGSATLACFDRWAKVTSGFLDHIGVQGFLDERRELAGGRCVDGEAWEALLIAWHAKHGSTWVSAADVSNDPGFEELLAEVDTGYLDAKALGKELRGKLGRWYGDYRVAKKMDSKSKTARWRVEKHGGIPDDAVA